VYSIRIKGKTLAGWVFAVVLGLGLPFLAGTARADSARTGGDANAKTVQPGVPVPLPHNLEIPHYEPGRAPFRNGETLVYGASWMGVPAAEATVIVAKDRQQPSSWTGKLWIHTSRAVDMLYRMRDYVDESFSRDSLRPAAMHILQHEKQRHDVWSVTFDDDAHLVTSLKRNAEGRTWIRKFSGGEPWGPFSGAMLALSLPLTVGKTYTFDIFSGGNRYVVAFNVEKRESITTPLGTFQALRIVPSILWLSQGKFRNQVSETVVWVSDDESHLPLRIEVAAYIGNIRVDLEQVQHGPEMKMSAPQTAMTYHPEQGVSILTSLTALLP
jgi:Protein of unknown function (DUF3108)